ncbi:hypothetical protein Taro_031548 [Colocasia esculenta]|uniref:RRM domain-containing protein n=1 Tax=Colocasia esculenta TaxID=4460 RepID=A0A843VQB2_COLES|nr:hypothetical protein [Colocasia esculenta]
MMEIRRPYPARSALPPHAPKAPSLLTLIHQCRGEEGTGEACGSSSVCAPPSDMEPSSPNISSEGLPVAELDLNLLTNKNESEAHKTEARSNYVEDGSQLEHSTSSILPSDVHYDGSASHSVMSDLWTSEPCLPSQSELSDDDGQRGAMDSEGLSSPVKEPFFGHEEVLNREVSDQKNHELPLTDEPANMHSVDISGSTKFGTTELYHEDAYERNGDHHAKMEGEFYSDKQHSDHEEDAPGESDAYFPRGFQERSTSPVERERSIIPESPPHIQASMQGETPSDVNHTRGSPYSNGSPRYEFSPSPKGPDKGRRRASSHDRLSPPKRRRPSPGRQDVGDSYQRVDSPCERRSSSPGRTPQIDLYNRDGSPGKHLSVSPLREDSSRKHGSPKDQDSLRRSSPQRKDSSYKRDSPQREDSPRRRDSPHKGDSPRRHDSPRRGESPRRRNSPRKGDSPTRRDSPHRGASPRRRDSPRRGDSPRKSGSSRRRDSPRKQDSPGGVSPRKHISSSPRRQDSSRRKERSMSRSPSGRRDSSRYKRDRHGRSRSRSPYGRDHHRRSPRRRHSPRRRSPSSAHHSRRHSPRRRPWSPPSNRSTGIGRPGKNLFVAGFSFVTTERDLEKKFSRYGRVTDVRIVRDKRSGDSRGFGFLSLERDEEADAAIRALDQTEWNGRIVLVEKAKTSVIFSGIQQPRCRDGQHIRRVSYVIILHTFFGRLLGTFVQMRFLPY